MHRQRKLIIGGFVGAALVVFVTLTLPQQRGESTPQDPKTFSDDSYEILFLKDSNRPGLDGISYPDYWVVRSDGTGLAKYSYQKGETNHGLQNAVQSGFLSMGEWYGVFTSPDGSQQLKVDGGWLLNFGLRTLSVESGQRTKILLRDELRELYWLPDNRRVVFCADNRIGIVDVSTGQYGYLSEGEGQFVVRERKLTADPQPL